MTGPPEPVAGEAPRRALDWPLAGLLAAGLLVRVVYLLQYARLPCLLGPAYDSTVYLRQAEAVRAGRFGDPTLVAFSPLYGYFLAAVGAPHDLVMPVVLQLLLGAASSWLVYDVGRRLLDRRSGLVALALWQGYGFIWFHETKIMAEALGMSLALVVYAVLSTRPFVRGRPLVAVAAGATLGLAILARANLVLTAPFVVLAALLPWRLEPDEAAGPRARLVRTAALAGGLALVLGAHGLWTLHHTGFFVPVIMVSETARRATRQGASGTLADMSGRAEDAGSPWAVVRQARERIERRRRGLPEQPGSALFDPWGALEGAPPKLRRTLEDLEISFFDYGYYGERTEVAVLRASPVTWGALELLALLGAVLLWRRRRWPGLVPLVPPILGALLTAVLFHPSSRYRLIMVLPLLWLGGYGLVHAVEIADRRVRWTVLAVAAAACLWLAQRTMRYELDHPGVWDLHVAEAWLRQQGGPSAADVASARTRIRHALEIEGDDTRVTERLPYLESLAPGVPLLPAPAGSSRGGPGRAPGPDGRSDGVAPPQDHGDRDQHDDDDGR